MKFFDKYMLYENKLLQPYINMVLEIMGIITAVASIAFIFAFLYEHGFILTATEGENIHDVYGWVWFIFLFDITLHIALGSRLKEDKYRRLMWGLAILFYLTLIPVIIPNRPVGTGPFLWIWDILHSKYYHYSLLGVFSVLYLSNGLVDLLGKRINPSLMLAVSFLVIILIGSGLLMLPRCTVEGISWVDALFISTSSVCITGLTSVDVATTFTSFGQTIIICLVQIGGDRVNDLNQLFRFVLYGQSLLV